MKFILGLLFTLNLNISFAGSSNITNVFTSTKSISEIRNIVTDVENLCNEGCAYHMPSVTRSQIIQGNRHANTIIYWTFVDSFVDISFFSRMNITSIQDGILITSAMIRNPERYVTNALPHSPAPMNNNQINMQILDKGTFREITIGLEASGGMVVTTRRLETELNNTINAYKRILN